MKLPSFRRLFKTDFSQEEQPLVEKLSGSLNNGIEVLYDALNNKISIRDNLQCTVKDVDVQVDSSGNPLGTTGFQLNNSNKVEGISVIRADNLTNSVTYPTNTPFISFTQNTSSIIINNVTGLQPNNIYRLRVIAWA